MVLQADKAKFVYYGSMDETKKAMMMAYPEFPDWKEDADKLFGPKEAVELWKSISAFLPPPERDLVVLGTSENIPTHLAAMWNETRKNRSGKVNFFVGDIGMFPVGNLISREIAPHIDERHSFNVFQWDAENLPVKPSSVDVIFDRAGWLWHCIREYKDESRLMNSLIGYFNLLKDGGVVVIDAIEGFNDYFETLPKSVREEFEKKLKSGEYFRPAELLDNPPGQYQPSTVDVMTEGTGEDFWFYVERFFDISDIGKGVTKVRVLKKKSKSEVG